jgi:hypothetical protein
MIAQMAEYWNSPGGQTLQARFTAPYLENSNPWSKKPDSQKPNAASFR